MAKPKPPVAKPVLTEEEMRRRALFVPCTTKERLHKWIKVFFDIDLPDSKVFKDIDGHGESEIYSNCTPLEMVWECYDKMRRNDDPDFQRVLFYSAREAGKTLMQSIIEVLCMIHLDRDVVHLAAIEQQAKKGVGYVKDFCSRPILRDFVVGDNAREVEVVRYTNAQTGDNLPERQFNRLSEEAKKGFERKYNYTRIIVATVQSANGEHSPVLCLDECDIFRDPRAYKEAQLIPSAIKGRRPLTILTSTRKFSYSLVQKEIDDAANSGLHVRHWNILDVTQACQPSRYKPDLPKLTVYRNDDDLKHVSAGAYEDLADDLKRKYVKDENVNAGCAGCKLYPMCRGRLITEQNSTSTFLKDIDAVISNFRKVDLGMAKAQLLCLKPSTEGLIYPALDKNVHLITAAQMAAKITGTVHNPKMTKTQLIQLLQARSDLRWTAGMDFGFSHNFAVGCGPVDGARKFYIEFICEPELVGPAKLKICEERIRKYNPDIYPDKENPELIQMFKSKGWKMRNWKKGAGTVQGGIEIVQSKIMPSVGEPEVYFLKGDPGCEFAFKQLTQYHWKTNPDGTLSKDPAKEDDDCCDAVRYDLMNVFAPAAGKFGHAGGTVTQEQNQGPPTAANWFTQVVEEAIGPGSNDIPDEANATGGANGFWWDTR